MKTKQQCPFEVPPFDPGNQQPEFRFAWWSWHPNYPYWSKSCWGGTSERTAWDAFYDPRAKLELYHNKLIREGDGKFTEIADVPCQRLDVWNQIKSQREALQSNKATA